MYVLQRPNVRPSLDDLTQTEARQIEAIFDPYAGEVRLYGEPIGWDEITEIEVAKAARASGPAGWLVKFLVHSGVETFHIGIYYGRNETVLQNISINVARYVVQSIAYYAPRPVRYHGSEGLAPLKSVDAS